MLITLFLNQFKTVSKNKRIKLQLATKKREEQILKIKGFSEQNKYFLKYEDTRYGIIHA